MPLVYTMNDEDGSPQIFAVEVGTGDTIGTADLNPALPANADPESIRLDVKTGLLYLADIGDNDANRPTFPSVGYTALYALPEFGPGAHGTLPCKRYPVSFPGGEKVNAESLAINPVNGKKYILTKEAAGSRLFLLPTPLVAGADNVMTLVRRLETKNATDATFTINGQWLLVRSPSPDIAVYDDNNFKKVGAFSGTTQAKGESIAAEPNGKSVLLGSEGRGGNNLGSPIYRVVLPTKYRGVSTPTPASPSESPTQPMATKPGQIINMRYWKLTMPFGDPDEILWEALRTYEHSKYFFDSNGRVVFNTPHGGVTTGGSVNPRTELREMWLNGAYGESEWSSTRGNHRMTLTRVSVNHAGANEKEVTFGQLHDGNDDRVMLKYIGTTATTGKLYAEWGNGKGTTGTLDEIVSSYTLGQVIPKIALNINASGFRVLVNDVSQAFTARTASDCFFKAGCYPQKSKEEDPGDFAQVRIGGIVVNHT